MTFGYCLNRPYFLRSSHTRPRSKSVQINLRLLQQDLSFWMRYQCQRNEGQSSDSEGYRVLILILLNAKVC